MLERERELGKTEGREEGQNIMAALINALLQDGRSKDIAQIASDPEFRLVMMAHYRII